MRSTCYQLAWEVMPARDMGVAAGGSVDDDHYRRHVDQAVQRGLSDYEAGRTFRHLPLVRRGDRRMADLFQSVVWTLSAREAIEGLFGNVFDGAGPRDHLLEQALDKAASFMTTTLGTAVVGSKIEEIRIMWDQARLMYRVESTEVFVVAVVPSLERWSRVKK